MKIRELVEQFWLGESKTILQKIRKGTLKKVNTKTTEGAMVFHLILKGIVSGKRRKRTDTSLDLYDLQVV